MFADFRVSESRAYIVLGTLRTPYMHTKCKMLASSMRIGLGRVGDTACHKDREQNQTMDSGNNAYLTMQTKTH